MATVVNLPMVDRRRSYSPSEERSFYMGANIKGKSNYVPLSQKEAEKFLKSSKTSAKVLEFDQDCYEIGMTGGNFETDVVYSCKYPD